MIMAGITFLHYIFNTCWDELKGELSEFYLDQHQATA